MRNSMSQPVKPKQTLTLFESSQRAEDAGKYLRLCQLVATATTRDVSAAATQVVKALSLGSFVIHMKPKESMGSQETRFLYTEIHATSRLNFLMEIIIIII